MLVLFNATNHKGLAPELSHQDNNTSYISNPSKTVKLSELQEGGLRLYDSIFILGDNGSGKTSYLDALYAMAACIKDEAIQPILKGNESKHCPSTYRIIITPDGTTLIEYEFIYQNSTGILRETLTVSDKDHKDMVVFDRVHTDHDIDHKNVIAEIYAGKNYKIVHTDDYIYWINCLDKESFFLMENILRGCDEYVIPDSQSLFLSSCWNYSEDWPATYGIEQICRFFEDGMIFWKDIRDDINSFSSMLSFDGIYNDTKSMIHKSGFAGDKTPFLKRVKSWKSGSKHPSRTPQSIYTTCSMDDILKLYILFAYAKRNEVLIVIDDFRDNFSENFVNNLIETFHNTVTNRSALLVTSHKTSLMRLSCLNLEQFYAMVKGCPMRLNEKLENFSCG